MKFKPKTYQEILDLAAGLESAGADKKNAKFSIRIATDKYRLKEHVECINETKEIPEEILALDKEKQELRQKYFTVAENGNTKIPDDKWPDFLAETAEMQKKNKKVEDGYEAQLKSYRELLKSKPMNGKGPLVIDLVEIPESFIPSTITGNQIAAIMPVVVLK
jgi:hypothetical protein